MSLLPRFLVCLSAAVLPAARAGAQSPVSDGRVRAGTLTFDGHATVGSFTGTTTTVTGQLTGGPGLTSVRGWVEAPVHTLVTGNGKRDRDLNQSMESDRFPTIRFDLTDVGSGEVRGDTTAVTLRGYFSIHGVRKEATIPAKVVFAADRARVWGEVPMNLKDYKIGGLTKMMGMLKMHEEILVHLDLIFELVADR